MPLFTIVGLLDSGLGSLRHVIADDADSALSDFADKGIVLVVLDGWHNNLVKTNTIGPDGEFQGKVDYLQNSKTS